MYTNLRTAINIKIIAVTPAITCAYFLAHVKYIQLEYRLGELVSRVMFKSGAWVMLA